MFSQFCRIIAAVVGTYGQWHWARLELALLRFSRNVKFEKNLVSRGSHKLVGWVFNWSWPSSGIFTTFKDGYYRRRINSLFFCVVNGEAPEAVSTLYVHKAHHADIKNQHLVIGQLKNPANQKQPALFCFLLLAGALIFTNHKALVFISEMGFVY